MAGWSKLVLESPHYLSPELLTDHETASASNTMRCKTDAWSVGVILYAMITGRLPFNGRTWASIIQDVQQSKLRVCDRLASSGALRLVSNLLQRDPANRWSLDEILIDPWLTERKSAFSPQQHTCCSGCRFKTSSLHERAFDYHLKALERAQVRREMESLGHSRYDLCLCICILYTHVAFF